MLKIVATMYIPDPFQEAMQVCGSVTVWDECRQDRECSDGGGPARCRSR